MGTHRSASLRLDSCSPLPHRAPSRASVVRPSPLLLVSPCPSSPRARWRSLTPRMMRSVAFLVSAPSSCRELSVDDEPSDASTFPVTLRLSVSLLSRHRQVLYFFLETAHLFSLLAEAETIDGLWIWMLRLNPSSESVCIQSKL